MYLILGYARTAIAVEQFFKEQNILYKIYDDKKEINPLLKFNKNEDFEKITRVITSPVFRTKHNTTPLIKEIQERNIEIISDLDLFYENLKNKENVEIIGITGTNGKSTTTALCCETLKKLGKNAVICGNFGIPVMSVLNKHDIYVLEVSSSQLEISKKIKFNLSVLLNITNDHLDYHGSFEKYTEAKFKILEMSEFSFVNKNLLNLNKNLQSFKNVKFVGEKEIAEFSKNTKIEGRNYLIGNHNLENLYYVLLLCESFNFNKNEIIDKMLEFKGIPHRLEFIKKIKNISIFNDSKATNLDSTEVALKSFNQKVSLIAGGLRKDSAFLEMQKNLLEKIEKVFLIGEAQESFSLELKELNVSFEKCNTLENAFKNAIIFCEDKNVSILLFSPLCASFDQYLDFEQRGNSFKEIVNNFNY